MKNILIPTDFSDNAWNAIKYFHHLFHKKKCNIYLLHVSDYIDYSIIPLVKIIQEDVKAVSHQTPSKVTLNKLMTRISDSFSNPNHNFISIHEHGFFLDSIKKNIEEKKIDLIIMGTKGASGLRQHIIGSNTGEVITKIKCNTLIIPKNVQFSEPKEVAFPTDYNIFYSPGILDAITEMLRLGEANIRVMNVTKFNRAITTLQAKNQEYLMDFLNESFPNRNSFHVITNSKINSAIQCFVESRGIHMIIMVAKNLNFLQQVLFDSIVEKISFHTKVPFFIIHEERSY